MLGSIARFFSESCKTRFVFEQGLPNHFKKTLGKPKAIETFGLSLFKEILLKTNISSRISSHFDQAKQVNSVSNAAGQHTSNLGGTIRRRERLYQQA